MCAPRGAGVRAGSACRPRSSHRPHSPLKTRVQVETTFYDPKTTETSGQIKKRLTPASLAVYDFVSIGSLTQEDPIGLAGGVNLYGFGDGDPVNFSDPFGLCKRPSGQGVGICIESFIQRRTVFGLEVGDNRPSSSRDGSYKTSQRFSIDPFTGVISGTREDIGRTRGSEGRGTLQVSEAASDGSGGWNVMVSGNASSSALPSVFAIDHSINLNISSTGEVTTTGGTHDGFPSYEIWIYPREGTPMRIYYHREGNFFELLGSGDVDVKRR